MRKNFLLIVRGKPATGKSTIIRKWYKHTKLPVTILDPDLVDQNSTVYNVFRPKQTKNPSPNVKMYAYLFDQALGKLKKGENVVWQQPWSRMAELHLTLRNLWYYFNGKSNTAWTLKLSEIIEKLPLNVIVSEVTLDNIECEKRYLLREGVGSSDERFRKTLNMYQKLDIELPNQSLDGREPPVVNAQELEDFICKVFKPPKKTLQAPIKRKKHE